MASIATLVHELTHIWQYLNWKQEDIRDLGLDVLTVYEGMATWAGVQYLYMIGETKYAMMEELITLHRTDVYGEGFRIFRSQYPFIKDGKALKKTPFNTFPPIG